MKAALREAAAVRNYAPVPARPQRQPHEKTYQAQPGKNVEMRVVRAAQRVGRSAFRLEAARYEGDVRTEPVTVIETAVGHLFVDDL